MHVDFQIILQDNLKPCDVILGKGIVGPNRHHVYVLHSITFRRFVYELNTTTIKQNEPVCELSHIENQSHVTEIEKKIVKHAMLSHYYVKYFFKKNVNKIY